jgi:hypothetical protein
VSIPLDFLTGDGVPRPEDEGLPERQALLARGGAGHRADSLRNVWRAASSAACLGAAGSLDRQ